MTVAVPIERLRWSYRGRDVTCENCHSVVVRMTPERLCPTCLVALGQDIFEVHNAMVTRAQKRAGRKKGSLRRG